MSLSVAIGRRGEGSGRRLLAAWWDAAGRAPMGERSPPQVWAAAEGRGDGSEPRRSSLPDARLLVPVSLTHTCIFI